MWRKWISRHPITLTRLIIPLHNIFYIRYWVTLFMLWVQCRIWINKLFFSFILRLMNFSHFPLELLKCAILNSTIFVLIFLHFWIFLLSCWKGNGHFLLLFVHNDSLHVIKWTLNKWLLRSKFLDLIWCTCKYPTPII